MAFEIFMIVAAIVAGLVGIAAAWSWWKAGLCENGYQIDITKLPEGIRYLRLYYAW
jgi:hypothetical protein